MRQTVRLAKQFGVKIGSHPGLPDREGFGRREMRMTREEVSALVIYQTGALGAFARAEGLTLSQIKPHGSLMGMALTQRHIAEGIADAAEILGLPLIANAHSAMSEVYSARGLEFACEFYVDLEYDDEGRQIITSKSNPVSPEVVARKVRRAIEEGLASSINGKDVSVVAESICVHSDKPGAIEVAKAVRQTLNEMQKA